MNPNPLRVFKVTVADGFRPQPDAEFELVALPFATPAAIEAELEQGHTIRGLRLHAWPSATSPEVRLIHRTWVWALEQSYVISVETCDWICAFRPSEAIGLDMGVIQ